MAASANARVCFSVFRKCFKKNQFVRVIFVFTACGVVVIFVYIFVFQNFVCYRQNGLEPCQLYNH